MNQPIFEVREKKLILVLGILCIVLYGAIVAMGLLSSEDIAAALLQSPAMLQYSAPSGVGQRLVNVS